MIEVNKETIIILVTDLCLSSLSQAKLKSQIINLAFRKTMNLQGE